jgi:isoamylase
MKEPFVSGGSFPGKSFPLGATVSAGGVNFCVFSKYCEKMELVLFDNIDALTPTRIIELDPCRNRTFYYWHIFLPGAEAGQLYGWRAHGPMSPERGLRFDGQKLLLDPYARCVAVGKSYDRDAAEGPGDNCGQAMKSVVVDPDTYDWEGDMPLRHPYNETVIYEMHVGGFTKHPNSGVSEQKRGTYAGLIEKIPYLKELGVSAVELLPIQQFDRSDAPLGHRNYWGYSPIAFFAPHSAYSSRRDLLGPVDEFRDMVKALHQAGIEVILDVVFNHTAEGDERGPTQCFRGLGNNSYYILESDDPSRYTNYSGCGNTINSNHSIMRRLITDCLRYWVAEMHVDGFRFDLASVMARDEEGEPLENPPILWSIDSDPVLAGTKLIAEAWDAAGLYQVGSFTGDRFAEWNGPFRDDIRRFVKSDTGMLSPLSRRIMGSPDLYRNPEGEPNRSINFVTCHDGFTLADLVSYNEKHNEANGEQNRDGCSHNHSWNCGVEGGSDDPAIDTLRLQQIKNLLTILLVSQGTPMLLMGDEVRRSQQGNNNAYCQNNELSWFNWDDVDRNGDLLRFTRTLIDLINKRSVFRSENFWCSTGEVKQPRISWHGPRVGRPEWGEEAHSIAFQLRTDGNRSGNNSGNGSGENGEEILYVILNAHWEQQMFQLPGLPRGKQWLRVLDSSLPSPDDIVDPEVAPGVGERSYPARGRSSVILMAGDLKK